MDLVLLDINTGEVVSSDVASYRTSKQQEKWKHKQALQDKEKRIFRTTGDKYTNGNMDAIRELATILDETTLGYLLIIQTTLQYDGTLGTSKRKFTKVKDFESVLNVKALKTKKVVKALRDVGVLYVNNDGVYCMNRRYHWKGKTDSSEVRKNVKLITDSIKTMVHAGVKAKDLGALYLLLPYINYRNNLIVHNSYETDVDKIQPMNLEDVADVIKYDATKISSKLRNVTFVADDGKSMYAFAIVHVGNSKSKHIRINPLLVRRVAEENVPVLVNEITMIDFIINRP